MKALTMAVVAASALVIPLAAFAQTDAPLTRAQVRGELEQLERAGYDPVRGDDLDYPNDLQAALARVASQKAASANGGVMSGSSESGSAPLPQK